MVCVTLLLLAVSCQKENDDDPSAIKDPDGNVYTSVIIETQTWLVENLKTTKYNDGSPISLVTDDVAWENLSGGGCCWYDNNTANKNPYGALYNWFAVETGKLCPKGWHVPSDTEWTTLYTALGGMNEASGKLKETGTAHWNNPNTGATNQSGFTALPGGWRKTNGSYENKGNFGVWWSSTSESAQDAWERYLVYDINYAYRGIDPKRLALSVRCLKD